MTFPFSIKQTWHTVKKNKIYFVYFVHNNTTKKMRVDSQTELNRLEDNLNWGKNRFQLCFYVVPYRSVRWQYGIYFQASLTKKKNLENLFVDFFICLVFLIERIVVERCFLNVSWTSLHWIKFHVSRVTRFFNVKPYVRLN